jgi:hypothetical protein
MGDLRDILLLSLLLLSVAVVVAVVATGAYPCRVQRCVLFTDCYLE